MRTLLPVLMVTIAMSGGVEIPEAAFLRIVEIVLEDSFDLADLRRDWARVPVS